MDFINTLEELDTIKVLDIWNEEFGGIDIDWTGLNAFCISKNEGDAEKKDSKENAEDEKNIKPKRGRPRLKPLKPEVLNLRRDVS
jgi:hypothetical protein